MLNYKEMVKQTDERINIIKAEANGKIKSEQQSVLETIEADFLRIGWNRWSHEQHIADGQYERFVRAMNDKKIKLESIDYESKSGVVKGSSLYEISRDGCSCSDCAVRRLPCKHMYFLFLALLEAEQ